MGRGGLVAIAAAVTALAACAPDDAGAGRAPVVGGGGTVSVETVAAALDTCRAGVPDAGIDALDAALARSPGAVDALATRGLCYWTRASISDADPDGDVDRAYDDLTAAIDAARAGAEHATPLDRLFSHRAFVARARDGAGWGRTLDDLDEAVRLAPRDPTHALDRGVARLAAGDTSAGRRDLARFLVLADSADAARREMVEAMIEETAR